MTYRPTPESLAGRLIAFLGSAPADTELTRDEIAAKFVHEGDTRPIHSQLIMGLDHDYLAYDPETSKYSLGARDVPAVMPEEEPAKPPFPSSPWTGLGGREQEQDEAAADNATAMVLERAVAEQKTKPAKAAKTAPAAKLEVAQAAPPQEKSGPRSAVDLTKIVIEDGIPLPPPPYSWAAFFDRFAVNQSAALPATIKARLVTAIAENKKRSKAVFTRRTMEDGSIRIWRTE